MSPAPEAGPGSGRRRLQPGDTPGVWVSLLPRPDTDVRVSLQHTRSGASCHPSGAPLPPGVSLWVGTPGLVPGVPPFLSPPPGRRRPLRLPLTSLGSRLLQAWWLRPPLLQPGLGSDSRPRCGKAREALHSCGAPRGCPPLEAEPPTPGSLSSQSPSRLAEGLPRSTCQCFSFPGLATSREGPGSRSCPAVCPVCGQSPDPQCHLPHWIGDARWGLLPPGSCLEVLMDPSL